MQLAGTVPWLQVWVILATWADSTWPSPGYLLSLSLLLEHCHSLSSQFVSIVQTPVHRLIQVRRLFLLPIVTRGVSHRSIVPCSPHIFSSWNEDQTEMSNCLFTHSSGGNKHVSGFSHTCVKNAKHLQTYNCVAFCTHVCLFPYLCVKIQTCVENSTQV